MDLHAALVKNVTFPLLQRRAGVYGLYARLAELERSQWLSRDEVEDLRLARLRALLRHAYDHTAYYRRVMDELGATPEEAADPANLRRLPTLTKPIINANLDDLLATNIRREDTHESFTGGTTGVRMKFMRDNACLAAKAAATIRQERWTGWDIGRLRGLVWPASQDYVGYSGLKARLRNALGERYLVLPAAVLDESAMAAYARQLRRQRPVLLRGFPSPLYLLADHIRRSGDGPVPVPSVIATGEPLYEHQRQAMREAFGATIFDSYGSRETGLIAQECPEHGSMHINAESLFLETVRDEVTGRDRLLVTDLLNHGMPMIRYEIGDTVTLTDRQCPCGRGLPVMEMGVGREADILYTPEGRTVSSVSLVLYLIDNGPPVGQVQVVQDTLDHLLVRITRTPPPDENLFAYYRGEVARLFGDAMRVTFEVVDGIPNEASGKYRFAVCNIPPDERPR